MRASLPPSRIHSDPRDLDSWGRTSWGRPRPDEVGLGIPEGRSRFLGLLCGTRSIDDLVEGAVRPDPHDILPRKTLPERVVRGVHLGRQEIRFLPFAQRTTPRPRGQVGCTTYGTSIRSSQSPGVAIPPDPNHHGPGHRSFLSCRLCSTQPKRSILDDELGSDIAVVLRASIRVCSSQLDDASMCNPSAPDFEAPWRDSKWTGEGSEGRTVCLVHAGDFAAMPSLLEEGGRQLCKPHVGSHAARLGSFHRRIDRSSRRPGGPGRFGA
eukprot:scaffold574_cov333-Pavlova_lutheri.AAC.4